MYRPTVDAAKIYNCRCSMREVVRGFYNKYTGKTEMLDDVPQEEYREKAQAYWNKVNAEKELNNKEKNGIIKDENTGGFSGAKKTEGWQNRHAERMYEEIRHRTTDVDKISQNTEFSREEVVKIKNHMFYNEYMIGGEKKRFDADYEQAQAWDRLTQGKGTETDKELLKHELVELTEMQENGLDYSEAHKIANERHNWWKRVLEGG